MHCTKKVIFFTLIELLVVIAIIAILASLLLPALTKAQQKAHEITCSSNMKQVLNAFHMYVNEYDGYTPFNYCYSSAGWSVGGKEGDLWFRTMPPYLGVDRTEEEADVLRCPSAPRDWFTYVSNKWPNVRKTMWRGGYSYSQPIAWTRRTYNVPSELPRFCGAFPLRKIQQPTKVMAFGECKSYSTGYNGVFLLPEDGGGDSGMDTLKPRMHGQGSNSGYVDGHVGRLTADFLIGEYNKKNWFPGELSTLMYDYPAGNN